MFIASLVLIILGIIPVFIIFYNSLLDDYNYKRDHIKYPFNLRAKYFFYRSNFYNNWYFNYLIV